MYLYVDIVVSTQKRITLLKKNLKLDSLNHIYVKKLKRHHGFYNKIYWQLARSVSGL